MENIIAREDRLQEELQSISAKKRTGTLNLVFGEQEYRINFQNGRIVDTESNEANFVLSTYQWLESAEIFNSQLIDNSCQSYSDLFNMVKSDPLASLVCGKELFQQVIEARILDTMYKMLSTGGGFYSFRPQGVLRNEYQPSLSVGQVLLNSMTMSSESSFVNFNWEELVSSLPQANYDFDLLPDRLLQYSKTPIDLGKLKDLAVADKFSFVETVHKLIADGKLTIVEAATPGSNVADSRLNQTHATGQDFFNSVVSEIVTTLPSELPHQDPEEKRAFMTPQRIIGGIIFLYTLIAICLPLLIWRSLFHLF